MDDKYLDHAVKFLDEYEQIQTKALLSNEVSGDEMADIMYRRWLILPMQSLPDHIEILLCERSYISNSKSDEIVAAVSSDLISEEGICPTRSLVDLIANAFENDYSSTSPDSLAERIRRDVEEGIRKGMDLASAGDASDDSPASDTSEAT